MISKEKNITFIIGPDSTKCNHEWKFLYSDSGGNTKVCEICRLLITEPPKFKELEKWMK